MQKLDLKKDLKHLYNPSSKAPVMLDVPPMNFLMIDGKGFPDGPDAVAGLASAKCTNEENYLFQKFLRTAIGTHNIDNCSRVCSRWLR